MRPTLAMFLALGIAVGGGSCGGDDAADTRADQIREAARDAGLPDDVVDVLALASRGTSATFQITYPGEEGTTLVVSQQPPNRRVDIVAGTVIVQSRVFRDGVGYLCTPPEDDPQAPIACDRSEGALAAPGAFTDEDIATFTTNLAESIGEIELTVEHRTVAEVDATCLVTVPKAGASDGTGPGIETLCLSDEGAQLLIDAAGERVVATGYTTDVPKGTFDVT